MVDDYNCYPTDNIMNISISGLYLDKGSSSKMSNKGYLEFENREEEKSPRSNYSSCNISKMDVTLKNMHKRWSMID